MTSACDVQLRAPSEVNGVLSGTSNRPFPRLTATDTLANQANSAQVEDFDSLNELEVRIARLRQRVAALRIAPMSTARIDRLRKRAQDLREAGF